MSQSAQGDAPLAPGDEAPAGAPGTGENVCPSCAGRGVDAQGRPCAACDGTGVVVEAIGGG